MVIRANILKELKNSTTHKEVEEAEEIVKKQDVTITKVIYNDDGNFSVHSDVLGKPENYHTYISCKDGEIDDLRCTCPDYESTYGTCKHILASAIEFNRNPSYAKLFSGEAEKTITIENKKINNEKYRIYRQMVNSFYEEEQLEEKKHTFVGEKVRIEPILIWNQNSKEVKIEFRIGNKQMYKIKNLCEFYDRMQINEKNKYGLKLEFTHTKEAFEEESIPILNFLMKYAEIIKYTNESADKYYVNVLNNSHIVVSNSAIDEFFDSMNGKNVEMQNEFGTEFIKFVDNEPEIKFKIIKKNEIDYAITTDEDIFDFSSIKGKRYLYFARDGKLYKCSKNFEKTLFKLLNIFRVNFTKEIIFRKEEFADFYSLIMPKVKSMIDIDEYCKNELENYKPKELKVKVYLDYLASGFITADIKFGYEDIEFNPFEQIDKGIPRNAIAESKALDKFKNSGFMLDSSNKLILVKEDIMYEFLKYGVEDYVSEFEVLATESFREKQVKAPKIASIGVKVENNLLELNLSGIDLSANEVEEIMKKYKLKKKFHRLKNGEFIDLTENDALETIEKIADGTGVGYKELISGNVKLPMYRSLYLDKILRGQGVVVKQSEEYRKLIDDVYNRQIDDKIELPKGLIANLREYQQVGYNWLKTLDSYKLGGILADDMGLGKTIQILAIIMSYVESINNNELEENQIKIDEITENKDFTKETRRPSLVVCPSSLTLNWKEEANKFTPTLKTKVISGTAEERAKAIKKAGEYDIVITSYDLLKKDIEIYKEEKFNFRYIIADEAQYIKNNNTKNARAIKEIEAETRFALTGTPIENSLSELWSIFDFVMPGYLFGYNKFKIMYETPIAKDQDAFAMSKLKSMIEPFILRRVKEKVLTELPEKTITVLNNEMENEQRDLYVSYMKAAKKEAKEEIELNGISNSQIKILALLMRLRQLCCHPGLFIENYEGESSKLNQCMEIIKDAVSGGHKILLFSGYSSMFWYLEKELKKENIGYLKLTGQTKVDERMDLVNKFNNDENTKVFLISLKAGGTGLNLIGADMVIHYDPWWNLSAENQATDRTYRIGQKRNVQVYKLITKNSIEEKIYNMQERKAKLADDMLSTKETFISKLSKDEIMDLFE